MAKLNWPPGYQEKVSNILGTDISSRPIKLNLKYHTIDEAKDVRVKILVMQRRLHQLNDEVNWDMAKVIESDKVLYQSVKRGIKKIRIRLEKVKLNLNLFIYKETRKYNIVIFSKGALFSLFLSPLMIVALTIWLLFSPSINHDGFSIIALVFYFPFVLLGFVLIVLLINFVIFFPIFIVLSEGQIEISDGMKRVFYALELLIAFAPFIIWQLINPSP